jgi:type II restriction enzyme
LTQDVNIVRPDGREVTLHYKAGGLNRLDRLTAANYGMPINTNLCINRFVLCNGASIMLQAASIYTKGEGGHWNNYDMADVMYEVAQTSLKMLGKDLFSQLSGNSDNDNPENR